VAWASWTYSCVCGKSFDYTYEAPRPQTVECVCGKRASWGFTKANFIHPTLSGRKYGEFDPQFGCVVESYTHKKQLLRERNMIESPPETKEQIAEDAYNWANKPTPERDRTLIVADSMEELEQKIDRNQVDAGHTGNSHQQSLQEGWVSFDPGE
jgi:hypothetical protein